MPLNTTVITKDRLTLFVTKYPAEAPKAGLLHIHGMNEHSGRFGALWSHLAEHGISVVTFDLRGHGLSQGPRGHLPQLKLLCEDVAVIARANKEFLGQNWFLFGHSLGAVIAGLTIAEKFVTPRGVIFSSPALAPGAAIPYWARLASRILFPFFPRIRFPPVYKEDVLTSIAEEQQKFRKDPLITRFGTPFNYVEIFTSGARLLAAAATWELPTLLVYGGADRLTNPRAMKQFFATMKTQDKTEFVEPHGRHELLFDTCAEKTLIQITDWTQSHIS